MSFSVKMSTDESGVRYTDTVSKRKDNLLPPSQRCSYECEKEPTGPLDRKKLIEHINKQALETPDRPEAKPYVPGTIRGKKWIPPAETLQAQREVDEQIAIDLGDEYEMALTNATQEEIIDLAVQQKVDLVVDQLIVDRRPQPVYWCTGLLSGFLE
ncbi:Tropomodulin-1 [Homalodisca vitripennis]|nr:Tropomodulin-1 [Homalodisca vitripennis]